jgi:hypothetical protein
MPNPIRPADLQPGDVLLYHGTGLISNLIRLFDGTEYSHAGFWRGDAVIEALGKGIVSNPLKTSVAGAKYVDVYRFLGTDPRKGLGPPHYPAPPVIAVADKFAAHPERYAYEQILLLALLAGTRRIPVPGLGFILRKVLDPAAEVLGRIIAAGRQPMICSELVYRCYVQAGAKYFLRIRGADIARAHAAAVMAGSTPPDAALAYTSGESGLAMAEDLAFEEEAAAFLESYLAAHEPEPGAKPAGAGLADEGGVQLQAVADFVTPGDLKKSPNLQFAGTLRL